MKEVEKHLLGTVKHAKADLSAEDEAGSKATDMDTSEIYRRRR
jgi:hypothetical protein